LRRTLRDGWSSLLPLVALLIALPGPALAAWMQAPAPYRPKDFTMIKKDGLYHLFYIRRNVTLPMAETERDFGHAVSADLYNWQQLAPVITVRDSSWDNQHVWAPSVIERDGVYYLFYTGVGDVPGLYNSYQRIGVATSTDLMTWDRFDPPIYSCDQVPWAFCDSLEALTAFRDPFVMPDPAQPGHFLMYYTGNLAHDSTRTVVGVAGSNGDLTQWSDIKPLLITHQSYSGNTLTESPHLFEHDGTWYMLFTTGATQPLAYATSTDPTGDPESWTYRGRLGTMLGANTGAWFASEYFRDGLKELLLFVNSDRVQINRIVWHADGTFHLVQPDLFHVVKMSWGQDTIPSGHPVQLKFVAVNGTFQVASLEAAVVDSNGVETPAPLDSLGLPASFTLPQDTTSFTWYARRWPSTGSEPSRVIVRLTDHTAGTLTPIVVLPDTTTPPSFEVTGLEWQLSVVMRGEDAPLVIHAITGVGHVAPIQAFTLDSTGTETLAPLDSLRLPTSIGLTGDTTVFHWRSCAYPSGNPPRDMLLRLRLGGDTLGTGVLRVVPDTLPVFDTFRVVSMQWSAADALLGTQDTLTIVSNLTHGQVITLIPYVLDSLDTEAEVRPDSLGLPFDLSLTSDTTRFEWTARIYPFDHPNMRMRLRLDSDTLAAQLITVWRDTTVAPPPETLQITHFDWAADSVQRGHPLPLEIIAHDWAGRSARLAAFTVDSGGTASPAPLAPFGLPDSVALVADTTLFQWTAVTWPDTSKLTRLRLQVVGDTLMTRVLSVLPDSVAAEPPVAGPEGGTDPSGPTLEHVRLRGQGLGMSGSIGFVVELDAPTPARLEVFDIAGRRVRLIANRTLPKGATALPWDGRDGAGLAADAGVYFVRLTTPRITRLVRAVVLR
jgi:hypothetical protein